MNADTDYDPHQWSEGQFLHQLEELETESRGLMDMLKEDIPTTRRIKSRIPRHIAALDRFANRCRAEIDSFGSWREDEADIEDIHDELQAEAESIVSEINGDLAMSWTLDRQELGSCSLIAAKLLVHERHLSGAELELLDDVLFGEIFDTRRLRQIAANHGQWFK